MFWLILLLIIGVFIIAIVNGLNKASLATAERRTFLASNAGWDVYVSPFGGNLVGINYDEQAIMVGTTAASRKVPFADIVSVEVTKDGASLTQTNRGQQLVGTAIGGLVLGPVGMLIGGLSGSSRTTARVSEISMKIVVDDRVRPVHVVTFLKLARGGIPAGGPVAQKIGQSVDHWNALLVTGMRNVEMARHESLASRSAQAALANGRHSVDVPSQLTKLWDLKQSGALTEVEFAEAKSRLLTEAGTSSEVRTVEQTDRPPARVSVKLVDRGSRPKDAMQIIARLRPDLSPRFFLRRTCLAKRRIGSRPSWRPSAPLSPFSSGPTPSSSALERS